MVVMSCIDLYNTIFFFHKDTISYIGTYVGFGTYRIEI